MSWLKFDTATPEKPEVLAITARMGWDDPDLTVGKLLRVWRWFDQHTHDGNAPGVTPVLLDRMIGVTGLAQAMAEVGWLLINDDGLVLPNFDRHNGETAKSRANTAKRAANHRAKAAQTLTHKVSNAESNAASVTAALPREEKRREEEKEKDPHTPKGAAESALSFKAWALRERAAGKALMPTESAVFDYAERVGIPSEFLHIAWLEFRHRYSMPGAKRYRDWRIVFRKSVEGNWLKLWWLDGDAYRLTTAGQQAKLAHSEKAA